MTWIVEHHKRATRSYTELLGQRRAGIPAHLTELANPGLSRATQSRVLLAAALVALIAACVIALIMISSGS